MENRLENREKTGGEPLGGEQRFSVGEFAASIGEMGVSSERGATVGERGASAP